MTVPECGYESRCAIVLTDATGAGKRRVLRSKLLIGIHLNYLAYYWFSMFFALHVSGRHFPYQLPSLGSQRAADTMKPRDR
jgi:hypothetical protein